MVRIKLLTFSHVLGLDELQVETGKVTKISGGNAQGKSSAIKGLLSLIEGGHEATLLKNGEKEAEIVAVVAADEGEYTFRKRVTETGSRLSAKNADGAEMPKAQELLNKLISKLGANPVTFLRGTDEEKLKWLLAATPLSVTREKLSEAMGEPYDGPVDGHAIPVLEAARKTVYDKRTGVNRLLDDAQRTVSKLQAGLAPETVEDLATLTKAKEAELAEVRAEFKRQSEAITTAKSEAKAELSSRFNALEKEIFEQLAIDIEAMRKAAAAKIAVARKQAEGMAEACDREADEAAAKLRAETEPRGLALAGEVGELKTRAESQARDRQNRKHYESESARVETLRAEAEALTNGLERLGKLRTQLLAKLPIPGLEIREGRIYYKGVILDQVNTAEQMKLAIKIATLRSKPGDPIVVDGLECFDPENMKVFEGIAEKMPYQFIFTVVESGPLKVEKLA